jgi:hypothetical protein
MTEKLPSADDATRRDGSRLSEGLGPLPDPKVLGLAWQAYTAAEMQAYASREVAAERDRCASRAWIHYMDVCKARRLAPSEHEHWNAARAVRSKCIDDDPMPHGHADISDADLGPNAAGKATVEARSAVAGRS